MIPELPNDNQMSSIDLPRVVITPDSPPVVPPPMFTDNALTDLQDNDIMILGRTSSVSAALFDFDPGPHPNDNEEDMLDDNNNDNNENNHHSNNNNENNEIDAVHLNNEDVENSSQSGQSMCSLSTATLSHGEVKVLSRNDLDEVVPLVTTSFTTLRCNSITVSPTEFPCVMERRQSTTSTYFYPPKSSSGSMNSHRQSNDCPENPFRKLFARRKEFYQTMSDINKTGPSSSASSSVNRMLLKKRHCTLCCSESRSCGNPVASKPKEMGLIKSNTEPIIPRLSPSSSRITLNAHIQPFAPFKISHDLGADIPAELTLDNSNVITTDSSPSDLVKILQGGSGLELSADGKELRYATSAINSEDGMESHLEVSLGKDGGVITTRHKRLGSPSEISNNSVVQVQYDEDGGKILNIQHTQQKKTSRPNSLNLASLGNVKMPPASEEEQSNHHPHRSRPSSTYCGGRNTFSALDHLLNSSEKHVASSFVAPLHNSLPNMYHNRPYPKLGGGQPDYGTGTSLLYNSHPADEEKRLAFTRALLSHQMEQRLKLEQELRQRAEILERVKGEVEELEYKLRQKEMIEHANHRSVGHADYLPNLRTSKPSSYKVSMGDIQRDVNNLQASCDKMVAEVTKLTKGQVPLGETSIEFYESLKNFGNADTAPSSAGPQRDLLPDLGAGAEGPQWSCSECTFLNHPALDHCEECEMPRIAIGLQINGGVPHPHPVSHHQHQQQLPVPPIITVSTTQSL
ncbi:GATA zinc finger domain-containing protein 7-like [Tigriopus californicus]|uniref:GATA zinc finger domain-containing protein 7-like n=1 Tax=Tigriopus californicus TaxID=6832 RepID=UPI0027DA04A0|nr:GATA zinc finger domain-containing protein 7-like [Tigriopus californicus]